MNSHLKTIVGTVGRHWKKIVGSIALLVALVVGGSWFYAKVWNQAPDKLSTTDRDAALDATVPPTTVQSAATVDAAPTTPATTSPTEPTASTVAPSGADGVWQALPTSTVGYRVEESINGFDTTAVGRTNAVIGTVTIEGHDGNGCRVHRRHERPSRATRLAATAQFHGRSRWT